MSLPILKIESAAGDMELYAEENEWKEAEFLPAALKDKRTGFLIPVWFRPSEEIEWIVERLADSGDGTEAAKLAFIRKHAQSIAPTGQPSQPTVPLRFKELDDQAIDDLRIISNWRDWNDRGLKYSARLDEFRSGSCTLPATTLPESCDEQVTLKFVFTTSGIPSRIALKTVLKPPASIS